MDFKFHPRPAKSLVHYMEYISTDDSEKFDIKHGALIENPLPGSTARYICNPIVDDIEAPSDPKEEYQPPSCLVTDDPSINDLASWRWQGRTVDPETERELIHRCVCPGYPRCAPELLNQINVKIFDPKKHN